MYKSQFINSLLLIGGVSTFPGATFAQQNSQVHQKNVLLILVDDLKGRTCLVFGSEEGLRRLTREIGRAHV